MSTQQSSLLAETQATSTLKVPVRDIIVDIFGANDQGVVGVTPGDTIPLELVVWDPEFATSGLVAHRHFVVRWGCMVLNEGQRTCPPKPMACPPPRFEPCPSGTLRIVPRSCNSDSLAPECDHKAELHSGEAGKAYRIDVNVTRDLWSLPGAIYPFWDIGAPSPVKWLRTVHRVKQFQVVQGKPVSVSVQVCSSRHLGTADLCAMPSSAMVNADDLLVLKTEARSGQIPFASFQWEVETEADAGRDVLGTPNVVAHVDKLYSNFLILKAGVLTPGRRLRLRVLASDVLSEVGEARIELSVRMPPGGGDMVVSPSAGVGMHTVFTLSANDWGTDAESMPLSFTFFCRDRDGEASHEQQLWVGTEFSVESQLPPAQAAQAASPHLLVGVQVSDIFASSAVASTVVTVASPTTSLGVELLPLLEMALLTRVDSFFRVGDTQNVNAQLALLAQTLNVEPLCNTSAASVCLSGELVSRQLLRARLLLTVQAANYSMIPSPQSLKEQTLAMAAILRRAEEIDFETANLAASLLANSRRAFLQQLGKAGLDLEAIAFLHGTMTMDILTSMSYSARLAELRSSDGEMATELEGFFTEHRVLPSTKTPISPRYAAARRRHSRFDNAPRETGAEVWLERLRFAKRAAEQGRRIPLYLHSEAHGAAEDGVVASEAGQVRAGEVRQSMNMVTLQKLRRELVMEAMSSISSLSVAQTLAGARPVVLRLSGCLMNTSHVTTKTLQTSGWRAESTASNYSAQVREVSKVPFLKGYFPKSPSSGLFELSDQIRFHMYSAEYSILVFRQ